MQDLAAEGIRVLSRRYLESYLWDDAVLTKLCEEKETPALASDVLNAKDTALAEWEEIGKRCQVIRDLSEINTPQSDRQPAVSADGLTLFRDDGSAIWCATRTDRYRSVGSG